LLRSATSRSFVLSSSALLSAAARATCSDSNFCRNACTCSGLAPCRLGACRRHATMVVSELVSCGNELCG
jgi:hypothetical protein